MKSKKKQYYTFLVIFYIFFAAVYGFIIFNIISMAKRFDNSMLYFMFIPILIVGIGAIFGLTKIIKNRERINRVFKVAEKIREEFDDLHKNLEEEIVEDSE